MKFFFIKYYPSDFRGIHEVISLYFIYSKHTAINYDAAENLRAEGFNFKITKLQPDSIN